ncbi:MAG: hypothetical protein Q7N87_00500 [Candidatus Uhrbacteria bacterium]|nr:hypothetical protein [Candidatus Uhrbacteria bacterium]
MPMDNTMEPAELPDLPSPAFAATNFPTGWPRPASVHVNTVPTVPNLRQHTVHNFTTGLGVAVQEGGVFLPVDSGVTMNVDPDGTGKYMLISVVPPGGAPDFTVALHGPPINRLLSFVCIEMQENGTGRVVGRHASRVPYGAGGYNTRDSYVTNWNCVGK